MKNRKRTKLSLNRETVRRLDRELAMAHGGGFTATLRSNKPTCKQYETCEKSKCWGDCPSDPKGECEPTYAYPCPTAL